MDSTAGSCTDSMRSASVLSLFSCPSTLTLSAAIVKESSSICVDSFFSRAELVLSIIFSALSIFVEACELSSIADVMPGQGAGLWTVTWRVCRSAESWLWNCSNASNREITSTSSWRFVDGCPPRNSSSTTEQRRVMSSMLFSALQSLVACLRRVSSLAAAAKRVCCSNTWKCCSNSFPLCFTISAPLVRLHNRSSSPSILLA
mmetsp:Transcript_63279/g.117726  ORF Transcript_63279/g.117726 Transcript_63279/m.117726 type:complete len:203 (-) Transcript_63279:509-1117(-)